MVGFLIIIEKYTVGSVEEFFNISEMTAGFTIVLNKDS